jgi:formamidase
VVILALAASTHANSEVIVGETGPNCRDDSGCFNRLHPDIPMAARAQPGKMIVFRGRDNMGRDSAELISALEDSNSEFMGPEQIGLIHGLIGPVYIEGARPGDVLAVTIEKIQPGPVGYTHSSTWGFAGDLVSGERIIVWRLNDKFAVSDDLPGVKIPNASFPGVITTLPGDKQLRPILRREKALLEAGGQVFGPDPDQAHPAELCGPQGTKRDECLRTIPPREHGGNMDIRYLGTGVTVYLPCFVEGCGLALGDFHYAQGDGEVAGTAIEMPAEVSVTTRIISDGAPDLSRGPHYEGPSRLLAIPSTRFYAVTGFPLKEAGTVPPEIAYLASAKVAGLENMSRDINLAARNALAAMIDHIIGTYGYDRLQAYAIAGVAVDLRIGQLVDVPNVAVTAILPLDIFEQR